MVDVAEAKKLLRYDEGTGLFYWLHRPMDAFPSANAFHGFSRFAGKVAGSRRPDGYVIVRVGGGFQYAHRLAWAFVNNAWPEAEIDHIDGDPSNNRLSNLRPVSFEENSHNMALSPRNKSGVMGVHWSRSNNGWVAQIRVGGEVNHLGTFQSVEDAAKARADAEVAFNFHENHGRRHSASCKKAMAEKSEVAA